MKIYGTLTKSDNALDAEASGRYPASRIARELGVPAAFVAECCPHDGEWHHVGKFANEVNYFSLAECREFLGLDCDSGEPAPEQGNDDLGQGAAILENWKREQKAKRTSVHIFTGVKIFWREFSGSRAHPTCDEYTDDNAALIYEGGAFVTVARACGAIMRKKVDGNHFELPDAILQEIRA
jgi:hypothetical protein